MTAPTLVVDASVAVKWILPEPEHEQADAILRAYQDEKLDLLAPYLLVSEVANVLWKRLRRGELSAGAASRCFEQLLRNCPLLVDSPAVSLAALELAAAHGRTVYDCLYLAWALEQRCDLVTADERFFRAVHPAFRCVRLLAEVQREPI
jgi:predicted nucleic acid-binding protein